MTCGIYKIQNLKNGKIYIGQSINIEQRWNDHISISKNNTYYINIRLYQAIRKYGLEKFSFDIIEKCTKNMLNEREQYWIQYYDSYNNGYNMTIGGQNFSPHGIKLTFQQVEEIKKLLEENKLLIKEIAKKYLVSNKTISDINVGKSWIDQDRKYPIKIPDGMTVDYKNNQIYYSLKPKCKICGKILSHKKYNICRECTDSLKSGRPKKDELKQKIRELPSMKKVYEYYNKKGYETIKNWCKFYNLPYKKVEINSYSDEEWNKL